MADVSADSLDDLRVPDTARRLAKYFGASAQVRVHLQSHYGFDRAEDAEGAQIDAIAPLQSA